MVGFLHDHHFQQSASSYKKIMENSDDTNSNNKIIPTKYDYCFKVILIGDSGVGKTSLLNRFADEFYSAEFIPTIGVDFKIRTVPVDDKAVRVQFWDTAGQERFRSVTTCYFRSTDGVIIVYDVTNPKSFQNISNWMKMVADYCSENVVVMIIGNKSDVTFSRQISFEQGQQVAAQLGVQFAETSAQADVNVRTTFLGLARLLKQRSDERKLGIFQQKRSGSLVSLSKEKNIKEKLLSCCKLM